jgi:hypothetical protein
MEKKKITSSTILLLVIFKIKYVYTNKIMEIQKQKIRRKTCSNSKEVMFSDCNSREGSSNFLFPQRSKLIHVIEIVGRSKMD